MCPTVTLEIITASSSVNDTMALSDNIFASFTMQTVFNHLLLFVICHIYNLFLYFITYKIVKMAQYTERRISATLLYFHFHMKYKPFLG